MAIDNQYEKGIQPAREMFKSQPLADGSELILAYPFNARIFPETGALNLHWSTDANVYKIVQGFQNTLAVASEQTHTAKFPIISYSLTGDLPKQYTSSLSGNPEAFLPTFVRQSERLRWLHADADELHLDATVIRLSDGTVVNTAIMISVGNFDMVGAIRQLVQDVTPIMHGKKVQTENILLALVS